MTALSHHLTVAGLLDFRFSIPCPPKTLYIDRITAHIAQHFNLHSPSDSVNHACIPPQYIGLLALDMARLPKYVSDPSGIMLNSTGSPVEVLVALKEGQGYEARHSIRLPNGATLRAPQLNQGVTRRPGSPTSCAST